MASNKVIISDFLKKQGLPANAVYGLMGNLQAESGLRSNNLQDTYEKSLHLSDDEYTRVVDGGAYPNFVTDAAGYGLAQWTSSGRKKGLLEHAKSTNRSISDLTMQLEWLWKELNGSYKSVLTAIKSAGSIREASDVVLTRFECPRDQSESMKQYRASLGEALYREIEGGAAPQPTPQTNPYPVPKATIRQATDDTRWLQFALNQKGYSLTVDGIWGNATQKALLDFQKKNGLVADGIVGNATKAKLM